MTERRGDRMIEPGVQERVNSKGEVTFRAYLGKVDGKAKWSPTVSTLEDARRVRGEARPSVPRDSASSPRADTPGEGLFPVPAHWRAEVARVLASSGLRSAAVETQKLPLTDPRLGVLFVANTGCGLGWERWVPGPAQKAAARTIKADRVDALSVLCAGAAVDLAAQLEVHYNIAWQLSEHGRAGVPGAKLSATTRAVAA